MTTAANSGSGPSDFNWCPDCDERRRTIGGHTRCHVCDALLHARACAVMPSLSHGAQRPSACTCGAYEREKQRRATTKRAD